MQEGAIIDVETVLDALRRHWLSAAFITLAGAVAGLGLSFAFEPVYRVEVVLQAMESPGGTEALQGLRGQFGGLASLAGINLGGDDDKEAAIATLDSDLVARRFIESNQLLPVLFADDWEPGSGWKEKDPERQPTLWDGTEYFRKEVRDVERDKLTGLVIMRINWRDPVVAARWANELVTLVNATAQERARDEARQSIEYLNRELASTPVIDRRQVIFHLLEQQLESIMFANVREDYAFRVIEPALPPDKDGFVFPNRLLFVAVGLILGAAAGLALAVARRLLAARPA